MIWKNVALQFEVTSPENIEEEVNAQRDSFVFKALFRDADAEHVVNDIELTIKRRCVNNITNNPIPFPPKTSSQSRESILSGRQPSQKALE